MLLPPKNRGGRPRKAPDEARSIKVAFRLRRDEYVRIAASGLSPTECIRAALNGVTIRPASGPTPHQVNRIARAVLAIRSGNMQEADALLSSILSELT